METATDRLSVVEREPGDAAEQREVRKVVWLQHPTVRVGLQGPAAVLAEEEPAARVQHFLHDDVEPLAPQPVASAILARKPNLRSADPCQTSQQSSSISAELGPTHINAASQGPVASNEAAGVLVDA